MADAGRRTIEHGAIFFQGIKQRGVASDDFFRDKALFAVLSDGAMNRVAATIRRRTQMLQESLTYRLDRLTNVTFTVDPVAYQVDKADLRT